MSSRLDGDSALSSVNTQLRIPLLGFSVGMMARQRAGGCHTEDTPARRHEMETTTECHWFVLLRSSTGKLDFQPPAFDSFVKFRVHRPTSRTVLEQVLKDEPSGEGPHRKKGKNPSRLMNEEILPLKIEERTAGEQIGRLSKGSNTGFFLTSHFFSSSLGSISNRRNTVCAALNHETGRD